MNFYVAGYQFQTTIFHDQNPVCPSMSFWCWWAVTARCWFLLVGRKY